ncbi:hypothetical protein [Colwellia sp. MEBiC06753]
MGYEPSSEINSIVDDTNMTIPRHESSEICDCYYIGEEGSYKQAFQGTGCNIVFVEGIDRNKTPECTAEIIQ